MVVYPWMERILASPRFLASTAACCGLAVALTTWVTADASGGARLLAALVALGATLAVMLLIAWTAAAEAEPLVPAPVVAIASARVPPPSDDLSERLRAHLARGEELDSSASDARVDAWIADVRQMLQRDKPGLVGYFDALSSRAFADDRARLDAYTRRLATIVRDLV